jgi:hypothetical protein
MVHWSNGPLVPWFFFYLISPHTCGARDSAALRPPEGPPLLTQTLISTHGVGLNSHYSLSRFDSYVAYVLRFIRCSLFVGCFIS